MRAGAVLCCARARLGVVALLFSLVLRCAHAPPFALRCYSLALGTGRFAPVSAPPQEARYSMARPQVARCSCLARTTPSPTPPFKPLLPQCPCPKTWPSYCLAPPSSMPRLVGVATRAGPVPSIAAHPDSAGDRDKIPIRYFRDRRIAQQS